MLEQASEDPTYREKLRELFHRDVLFAFNGFFYTLDVRKRPQHHQPFCTYEFQDIVILDLVKAIKEGTAAKPMDRFLEKSRDMGVSWILITIFVWFWLNPQGGADFLLGSRIEDYVDKKGDMRTLFEKARYLLYKLPHWLLPEGFNMRYHDNFMKLVNPQTGSSITGESNNPNFSTGGRYAAVFFDEFAKWESTDGSAWMAAGDATPCRIAGTTPFGAAGKAYELSTDIKIKKHILHWSLHPEKSQGLYCVYPKPKEADKTIDLKHRYGLRSPWYDGQCARRDPQEIAQELDIDYIGAGSPVFDGEAGRRILIMLKRDREPLAHYRVSYGKAELEYEEYPNENEDYVVVYEEPRKDASYIIAGDVAEGLERSDYSVVKVLRRETKSIVATYYSRIDEIQLARIIYAVTKYYSPREKEEIYPWWAVETTGPGLSTFDHLTEVYDLPNPYMMPRFDTTKQAISYRKGWWTASDSRKAIVGGIKKWLTSGAGWCDLRCLKEMITFAHSKTGKPEAQPGATDDEVMCFGIALKVDETAPEEEDTKKTPEELLEETVTNPAKFEPIKEPTMEEICYAQALSRRDARANPDYITEVF